MSIAFSRYFTPGRIGAVLSALFIVAAPLRLSAGTIERRPGPLFLGMPLPLFLQTIKGKEGNAEAGQFQDERRFRVDGALFAFKQDGTLHVQDGTLHGVEQVVCDFYQESLFRIEINYRPVPKVDVLELKDKLILRYGPPRRGSFQEADILFWDDGETRLIFEEGKAENRIVYSMTYLDHFLFHRASRERIGRELEGIAP